MLNFTDKIKELVEVNANEILRGAFKELFPEHDAILLSERVKTIRDADYRSHFGFDCGISYLNVSEDTAKRVAPDYFVDNVKIPVYQLIPNDTMLQYAVSVQSTTIQSAVLHQIIKLINSEFKTKGKEFVHTSTWID